MMKPNLLLVVLDLQFVGEKVVAALARSVSDRYNVFFCCLDQVGLLGEDLQKEGYFVKALDRHPGFDRTIPGKIAKLTRDLNIHLIHAHHYTPFSYSAMSRLIHHHPRLLFTEHGRNLPDIVKPHRKLVNLILNPLTDGITSVCEYSKRALHEKDWFPLSKIEVIYNGIEQVEEKLSKVDEDTRRVLTWLDSGGPALGFLARLDPIKDPFLLIESFHLVHRRIPGARLVVMGKGPMREELEARCRQYGIAEHVLFTGLLKNPMPVLPRLRGIVMTSLSEASSLSILEAMMCGTPVIAGAVGGNPEHIHHQKTGFLVPGRSAEGFAEPMGLLLEDESLWKRLGQASRKDASERFSFESMVKRYRVIYEKLLQNRLSK